MEKTGERGSGEKERGCAPRVKGDKQGTGVEEVC